MADKGTLATGYRTESISTGGDTWTTRARFCKARNLGANSVAIGEASNPAGGVPAVGDYTVLNAKPATGKPDEVILKPLTTYYLRADTAAVLVALEEIPGEMANM